VSALDVIDVAIDENDLSIPDDGDDGEAIDAHRLDRSRLSCRRSMREIETYM
jgi:hypothetical protein